MDLKRMFFDRVYIVFQIRPHSLQMRITPKQLYRDS